MRGGRRWQVGFRSQPASRRRSTPRRAGGHLGQVPAASPQNGPQRPALRIGSRTPSRPAGPSPTVFTAVTPLPGMVAPVPNTGWADLRDAVILGGQPAREPAGDRRRLQPGGDPWCPPWLPGWRRSSWLPLCSQAVDFRSPRAGASHRRPARPRRREARVPPRLPTRPAPPRPYRVPSRPSGPLVPASPHPVRPRVRAWRGPRRRRLGP